jgi:hypothetical protein
LPGDRDGDVDAKHLGERCSGVVATTMSGTVTIRTGEIDEPTNNQRSRTLGLDKATIEILEANRRQQLPAAGATRRVVRGQ